MADALSGKVAVITGGAAGIGLATAELFIAEGAKVVVADIQAEAGEAFAAAHPGAGAFVRCDVTREADIAGLMQAAAARFGGIDILFNNAGATPYDPPLEAATAEAWDHVQALLLRSVALGMHHVVPFMKEKGGAIVNTASVAGVGVGLGPFSYSVAKAGVRHLSKLAAAELSHYGIRVNVICPGLILTDIHNAPNEAPVITAAKRRRLEALAPRMQPLRRKGQPQDIAQACLYLASDAAAFVTGAEIVVDGGLTLGGREAWDRDAQAERAAAAKTWIAEDLAASS
jgi:NAD(P)-dependent dehydrogenase (short-subunit alcohol dehydrogenase family)